MDAGYKIGEVADILGITVRAIRYYEEENIVEPLKTEGGTRFYTRKHVSRLKSILHLAENGFSIESIRTIAAIRERAKTGDESSRKVSAQLEEEIEKIAARIEDLQNLKKEITKAHSAVQKCHGCKNRPTTKGCPACPVIERANSVELLNLIWDQS